MEAVSAARARATEIAQQCAALPKLIPTASHRRRLARLRASELWKAPAGSGCRRLNRANLTQMIKDMVWATIIAVTAVSASNVLLRAWEAL